MVSAAAHVADADKTVVDFRGNPIDNSLTGGWLAAGLILGTELSERICAMSISMNLVTYLVGDLHLPTSKSATIVTNFMGTLNLLALLGGFVADAKLGRYMTVVISASITTLGMSLLIVATTLSGLKPPSCNDYRRQQHECVAASGKQLAMLYVALYTTALGAGGVKSSVSGFGSDQFDSRDPKEEKAMIFFFNRFYFCISLGSLFAVTVLVYVQDNVGRGCGYGIAAVTMVLAFAVLIGGSRFYRYKPAQGSPLTVIWRVVYLAWRKRKLALPPSDPSLLNEYHEAKMTHTQRLRFLDKAAVVGSPDDNGTGAHDPWTVSTVAEVEEVKMVVKLLPIWSTSILFWTVYSQMTTFSVEQATFMNRNLGSFVIPSGSFSFFLFITILLFTSLNEKLLVPFAHRFTHHPKGITSLQRIAIGLIFSALAMASAAIVEKKRRALSVHHHAPISAFWLIPQYFLVGAGEAFAYVGQLEFFITEAPERMKSMSTGLFLTTLSMGFFVSSLLVSLVDEVTKGGWIKNNLDRGRLDYFYWLLAVLSVLNFFIFLLFTKRHEYKVRSFVVGSDDRCVVAEKEEKVWNEESVIEMREIHDVVDFTDHKLDA